MIRAEGGKAVISGNYLIEFSYLLASILFIYGLKGLSNPKSARRGMNSAALGMLVAIVGTLLHHDIIDYTWIIVGLLIGGLIGAAMSIWMPMTAMPQRTALSHAFGALAASLVGISEYYQHVAHEGGTVDRYKMIALGFEVLFGSLTVTGSLLAFVKLQELMRGSPVTYKGQNVINVSLFIIAAGIFIYLIYDPTQSVLYVMVGLSFLFGILLVLPIGSADMPVVMSLMNSYAGLASAATGFAIGNNVLIIAGTLDGFSGFILSILMCKAMNRSVTNVLGAFGSVSADTGAIVEGLDARGRRGRRGRATGLRAPGGLRARYGMATAQAQHAVRELAEVLEHKGVNVKYALPGGRTNARTYERVAG